MHVLRAAEWLEGDEPRCEFAVFWETLPTAHQNNMLVRFKRFANTGTLQTPRQLRTLEGGLFEFKHSDGPRILAYHAGQRARGLVILTHGFIKKSDKTPPNQINRAATIRGYMGDAR